MQRYANHPDYNVTEGEGNDIALIQLKKHTGKYVPICLPLPDEKVDYDDGHIDGKL